MSQQFLHYTITSTLERRTASTTYLANHKERLARTVVLKIFQKPTFDNAAQQEKFTQEMDKLIHLNHPHIVPILEAGIEEERAYIVSTYMPNGSLRVRLDRNYPQRLPIQQALMITTQIGQALVYLHARYLTHGQIKPEHVLFDTNGRASLSEPYNSANTPTWVVTNENASDDFRYLAPEQFDGEPSGLSDQYALCCMAYELLTGRPPFTLRDPQALEEQQRYAEPSPLRQFVPNLSPAIEQAIMKGLAKEPERRHADIAGLLVALQQVQPSITGSNPPVPRSKRRTSSLVPSPPSSQSGSTAAKPSRPSQPGSTASRPSQPIMTPAAALPDKPAKVVAQAQSQPASQPMEPLTNSSSLSDEKMLTFPPASVEQKVYHTPPDDFDAFLRELAIEDDADLILSAPAVQEAALPDNDDGSLEDIMFGEMPEMPTVTPISIEQNDISMEEPAAAIIMPPAKDESNDPFEDILQEMVLEEEMLVATSSYTASIEDLDQEDYADAQTIALGAPGIVTFNAASIPPIPPVQPIPVVTPGRQARMRPASMILLSLLLLLMLISLITYNALAASSSPSSTLAMLSAITKPTPKATVDTLGILSPSSQSIEAPPITSTAQPTPKPTAKPKPKPTAKPKPKPTPTPNLTLIPTPTALPIAPISVPTTQPAAPTPKPTAKPTSVPATPVGQTIWLKSTANGEFVSTSLGDANAPLLANQAQAQAWEKFRVVDAGNGMIALQSVGNGDYVSVMADTANAPLEAQATVIDDWEEFHWVNVGSGDIALLSNANGNYVSTWISTANTPLYAQVTSVSAWETLQWGTAN